MEKKVTSGRPSRILGSTNKLATSSRTRYSAPQISWRHLQELVSFRSSLTPTSSRQIDRIHAPDEPFSLSESHYLNSVATCTRNISAQHRRYRQHLGFGYIQELIPQVFEQTLSALLCKVCKLFITGIIVCMRKKIERLRCVLKQ